MKILLIYTDMTNKGGITNVVHNLAKMFIERLNYNVEIASLRNKDAYTKSIYHDIHINLDEKYKTISKNNLVALYMQRKAIKKYLKENNFDWVISFDSIISIHLCTLFFKNKTKFIASEHLQFSNIPSKFRMLRNMLYFRLNKVITLTKDQEKLFKKINKNVITIPNSIELTNRKSNVINNKKILLAGRFVKLKRFDLAINIFKKIYKYLPEWSMEIIGEGPEEDNIRNLIIKYNMNDKIILSNFTDKIEKKYLESSIYLLTSQQEVFPMVLLEALSYGVPCIAFDIMSGPKDIIEEGINGYLIEDGNIDAMGEKILEIIKSGKYRELSEMAKKSIAKFDESRIVNIWKSVLQQSI